MKEEALCYRPRAMKRANILGSLRTIEDHVWSVERQIANRRDYILSLKCAGCDTSSEVALMREMEDEHMEYVAERDRLCAELTVLDALETAQAQLMSWSYGTS